MKTVLILHDVRSKENVGAIFRTADAAGISEIFLTGYSPAPLDRFGRVDKSLAKSALGAEKNVSWKKIEDPKAVLKQLRKEDYRVIAIEQAKNSKDYKKIKIEGDTVFVLGNETEGLPKELLELADEIAEIPMNGKKESLNVSVAAGIAIFRILDL
jgi:23S rRNA (guanosine2251-2'-O)-methyltransferase